MDLAKQIGPNAGTTGRRRAVGLLARAMTDELRAAWDKLPAKPEVKPVRGPETGLVMIRGR
ncbi:phosphonate C-P lyase system protein PhnG, partial [Neorhizobium sp. BETTINA12A]|uniref:phosphonate C-P lyase system protein PhnG n=1 Tax=Neorhizobium sp. BETTINA12A TaxID=2908924 RepID=UPI001FF6D193